MNNLVPDQVGHSYNQAPGRVRPKIPPCHDGWLMQRDKHASRLGQWDTDSEPDLDPAELCIVEIIK